MAHEGHSYETLKQMVADWQKYAGTQHVDIMRLLACMHALQREIFAMREQERQRLSTAETMRLLTGGADKSQPRTITVSHDMAAGPNGTDPMVHYAVQLPATLLVPINNDPPPVEEQPPPIVNHHPIVQDLVRRDMDARKQLGIYRYGTPLQPFNGRDALCDLYEELLDAVMYIRQVMYERDRK